MVLFPDSLGMHTSILANFTWCPLVAMRIPKCITISLIIIALWLCIVSFHESSILMFWHYSKLYSSFWSTIQIFFFLLFPLYYQWPWSRTGPGIHSVHLNESLTSSEKFKKFQKSQNQDNSILMKYFVKVKINARKSMMTKINIFERYLMPCHTKPYWLEIKGKIC